MWKKRVQILSWDDDDDDDDNDPNFFFGWRGRDGWVEEREGTLIIVYLQVIFHPFSPFLPFPFLDLLSSL